MGKNKRQNSDFIEDPPPPHDLFFSKWNDFLFFFIWSLLTLEM